MLKSFSKFKPGAKKKTILLLSAVLWTAIGIMLFFRGVNWLMQLRDMRWYILSGGIVVGVLKSYCILDKTARRGIDRILSFADGTCLGAVYSIKTWLLVVCMMTAGIILRNSSLPVSVLSFLYIAIGSALGFSSRLAWLSWLRIR